MRHHWLAVIPRTAAAKQRLPWRVEHRVVPRLIWKPEQTIALELKHGIHVLSFASNGALLGFASPIHRTRNGLTLVSGLPSLEDYDRSPDCDVPCEVSDILASSSAQDFYLRAGGTWSVLNVDGDHIDAFSDFSGYQSLCYGVSEDYVVIGNRASLVAAITTAEGQTVGLNYDAVSWTLSTTMIQGHDSAFKGVRKLEPGTYLTYTATDDQIHIAPFRTNYYTPLANRSEKAKRIFLESRIDGLARRARWLLDRGTPFQTDLTGGKDSRAILGLLLRSGGIDRLRSIRTRGNEDNGDVIIAQRLTRHVGLSEMHEVIEGEKGSSRRTPEQIARNLLHSFAKYDGQLTPYDGMESPFAAFPTGAHFMGGGGGIIKHMGLERHNTLRDVTAQLVDWSCRFDRLRILSDDEKGRQSTEIADRAADLLRDHIQGYLTRYILDHRVSNWGSGDFQGSAGNAIPLLIDIGFARLMFTTPDMDDTIHFEILRQCDPRLLQVPFQNQKWYGATHDRAVRLGFDLDPVHADVERNFPWQFEVYRTRRDQLVRMILDFWTPELGERVDRSRVEDLIGSPMEFNSASIKMLLGLASCAAYGRASETDVVQDLDAPDFEAITVTGNYLQDEIGTWIRQKRSNVFGHPVFEDMLSYLQVEAASH